MQRATAVMLSMYFQQLTVSRGYEITWTISRCWRGLSENGNTTAGKALPGTVESIVREGAPTREILWTFRC